MVNKETMKLALEALEDAKALLNGKDGTTMWFAKEITALREALNASLAEQPAQQQEPVAYIHRQGNHYEVSDRFLSDDEKSRGWTEEPLYTSPPAQRKPWVGLTEEERAACWNEQDDYPQFAAAIETKLKDKNYG